MKTINELCDIVRQTAYDLHTYHGNGHLEKVYENALAHRLRKTGFEGLSKVASVMLWVSASLRSFAAKT
jgi:hypothetical protein